GRGGGRTIALSDFHLLPGDTPDREHALRPGELITAVSLPPLPPGARQVYVKLRDRESFEFALASAAVVLWLDGGRVRESRIARVPKVKKSRRSRGGPRPETMTP